MNEELYKEYILDLYKNPLNRKELSNFDFRHREFNPLCGDEVDLMIKFDKSGKVSEVGWQGQGCAISQASASLFTDKIKGMNWQGLIAINPTDVLSWLGLENLNPTRQRCALLVYEALKKYVAKN